MPDEKIKILCVEDNAADFRFIKETLLAGGVKFMIENVRDIRTAKEYLNDNTFDLLLLDLSLPDSKGSDSYERIRAHFHDIPVIILTGTDDEELAMKMMQEGAEDYILKDKIDYYILSKSIRHAIERNIIKKEIKESQEKYSRLFENMSEAFAYFRTETGQNGRYVLEEANEAFIKIFWKNIKKAEGAQLTDIFGDNGQILDAFELADKSSRSSVFECVSGAAGKWYEISVYKPMKNHVAMIVADINSRKETEKKLSQQSQLNILRAEIWRIASQMEKTADQIIQEVTETAGPVLGVSRVKHNKRIDHNFVSVSEWCDSGVVSSLDTKIPEKYVEHILRSGGITVLTQENVADHLPLMLKGAAEGMVKSLIEKLDLAEVIAMPYFINGEMAGAITFDVCTGKPRVSLDGGIKSIIHDIVKIVSQAIVERRIYDELAESRAMYKTLFENMTNGFAYCRMDNHAPDASDSDDFIMLESNSALEKMLGKEKSTLVGQNGSRVLSENRENFGRILSDLNRVAMTGGNAKFEYYSRSYRKWLYVNAYSTKRGYFAMVFEDISERKKVEEELIRSEERFKTLFDSAPYAYFLADIKGNFIDINKKTENYLGFTREELIGRNYLEFNIISPSQYAKAAMTFLKTAMGVSVESDEYTARRKDGREIVLQIHTYPVKIGGEIYLFGSALDVTERRKTEEALRESEEKYKAIFDNISSGFMFISTLREKKKPVDYRILEVNEAMLRHVKASRDSVTGKSIKEVFSDMWNDTAGWPYFFEKASDGIKLQPFEYYDAYQKKWFSVMLYSPMRDHLACVVENITHRKESEQSLKDGYEKLKEIDRLKTSFISMVSHELRTPMTSIKGFTALVKRGMAGPVTNEQGDYLEKIESNSERMLGLVNDLLDASKMESGTFKVKKERCDIEALIRNDVNDLKGLAGKKNITIRTQTPGRPINAMVDPARFSQTIANLVNNAVKFSPENSEITVGVEYYPDGFKALPKTMNAREVHGPHFLVYIIDNGIGVPPEHTHKVFDKFYQVEDPETRKFSGTGLGLSITKSIVEAHGGMIWLESEGRNRGAAFKMLYPEGE